eukprot:RCo042361
MYAQQELSPLPDRVARAEVLQMCAMVKALRKAFKDSSVLCAATAFALYRDHPKWDVRLVTPASCTRKAREAVPRMVLNNVLTLVTENNSHIVIDFEWRDHFSIKCRTQKFDEFYQTLSSVFVGTMVTLTRHLQHHGAQVESCFRAFSIPIPPWRTAASIVSSFEFHIAHAIPIRCFCETLLRTSTAPPPPLPPARVD